MAGSRRLRLLIGASAGVLIAVSLTAPLVLLSGGGSSGAKSCVPTLHYRGRTYVARQVSPGRAVEVTAIGVGVTSGCGVSPSNVDVRSVAGVRPSVALGVPADQSSIYVRGGVCRRSSPGELVTCLRRSG